MTRPALPPNAWFRWDRISRELRRQPPGVRILEVGTGGGAVGARLAAHGRYTGVERDDRSRDRALEVLGSAARVVADVTDLAPEDRFDVLCSFEVLEHIDDHEAALSSWSRHLEPGGQVWLSMPAHQHRFSAWDDLAGHLRRYSRDDLGDLVDAAGLELVRVDSLGVPVGNLLEVGRNLVARRRGGGEGNVAERTAASGRLLQPPPWAAGLMAAVMLPARWAQRPFLRTSLGPGWFVVARRPRS